MGIESAPPNAERGAGLNHDEFWAVYEYITAHKDEWDETLKRGLLKLVNTEARYH